MAPTPDEDTSAYELLVELEDLESLLEELEEDGLAGEDPSAWTSDLRERLVERDLKSADQLRERIRALHIGLDRTG